MTQNVQSYMLLQHATTFHYTLPVCNHKENNIYNTKIAANCNKIIICQLKRGYLDISITKCILRYDGICFTKFVYLLSFLLNLNSNKNLPRTK